MSNQKMAQCDFCGNMTVVRVMRYVQVAPTVWKYGCTTCRAKHKEEKKNA